MGFFSHLLACGAPEPVRGHDTGILVPPCQDRGDPVLEMAGGDGAYGVESAAISFGHPPQGGAPYAPFRLRVAGLDGADEGWEVDIAAVDGGGVELGYARHQQRFTCSNVGEDAGSYISGEIHLRFYGYELGDLPGIPVVVTAQVEGPSEGVTTSVAGSLVSMEIAE